MNDETAPLSARARATTEFRRRFDAPPQLMVRAPGRVNLIGEHTDYNDGFVFPAAIDRELWIALRPRDDARVHVASVEFGDAAEAEGIDLRALEPGAAGSASHADSPARAAPGSPKHGNAGWLEYVKGVAWALLESGAALGGWEGVVASDVPVGAGLSSSAALEMATLRAFSTLTGLPWAPAEAATLGKRVENEWVGVNSGIMDQLAVAGGRRDHALLIDCRTLEVEPAPLPPELALVVLDTGTRRGLVGSAYNERREQCDAAAAHLGVDALRDADLDRLEAARDALGPVVYRRARHVITENQRTLDAAAALRAGDAARLGALIDASHASLRDDFEVSTDALDAIVALAREQPGCFGARMTGAGFGGCAIAVVDASRGDALAAEVMRRYADATGLEGSAYVCRAADGASVERPEP